MTFLLYLVLGILTSVIGALPLGATNIAVINVTLKKNLDSALKIVYPAALAEIIVVIIALSFSMQIVSFFESNLWIQILVSFAFLGVGSYLYFYKKSDRSNNKPIKYSNGLLGFTSALINPPVFIYWILVIPFLNNRMIALEPYNAYDFLIVFLVGVFIGKSSTLITYGKLSHYLKKRTNNIASRINKLIGLLLIIVSIFQLGKVLLT